MNQSSDTVSARMEISALEAGIVKVMLYFDIFSYPLTAAEIHRLHPVPATDRTAIDVGLEKLVRYGIIAFDGEFYEVGSTNRHSERRKKGNALAAETMIRAHARSRFVSQFPFVRSVMISGSLSKNYMEPTSDIDFFVITKSGRLWVARTMLILYKKIFLLNSHKEFCMNYFIDTDHLQIEDKNIFTATEVVFLLPTYNPEIYREFHGNNTWSQEFYPNHGLRDLAACAAAKDSWLKRTTERLLNGRLGEWADAWCMRRTIKQWQKKFAHFTPEKLDIALRSRKYVSKHHPSHFQERVMNKLNDRQREIEEQFGISLAF